MSCKDIEIKPHPVVTPPVWVGAVLDNCGCEPSTTTTTTTGGS